MAIAIIQGKQLIYKDKKKPKPRVQATTQIKQPVIVQQQLINDIYGEDIPKKIKAVDIKVDRKYNVSTVDENNIKSDVVNTKVNNNVDKLRRLRRGH